jgi:hypothetical protein
MNAGLRRDSARNTKAARQRTQSRTQARAEGHVLRTQGIVVSMSEVKARSEPRYLVACN